VPGLAVRAAGLRKTFEGGLVRALDGLDLEVTPGEVVAITGPTGCGKSTLLSLVALLDRPDSGSLVLGGTPAERIHPPERWRARHAGIVFQLHHLLLHLSVADNLAVPLVGSGLTARQRAERVASTLERLGLGHRARARAATLSGGERQLTAVGRALVGTPDLVLADEPTGSVDSATGARILDLLLDWNREHGATILLVTHDHLIAGRAHRTVAMLDGRVVTP
jgi:putative ABC transport system ATP-binding protein